MSAVISAKSIGASDESVAMVPAGTSPTTSFAIATDFSNCASGMAASFWGECKRVSNRRIKDELGVALAYPSYREGLAALHAAGEGPRSGQAA